MMAEEIISVRDLFYILSTSSRIDDRTRVLKHDDTFAVFDRFGDIETYGTGELGLYYHDTRFVSHLALKLEGDRPLLLSSVIKNDNAGLAVDVMNPDIWRDGAVSVLHGTVHIFRSKFLWKSSCYERIHVHNYGNAAVALSLSIAFDADFADIFEVRGADREHHGHRACERMGADTVLWSYEGLDGIVRRTRITFDPPPTQLTESEARYEVRLQEAAEEEYRYSIQCEMEDVPGRRKNGVPPPRHNDAFREAAAALQRLHLEQPDIYTSNEQFNDWLNRSTADLTMMRTDTPFGPYPYAGVPWFCTAFGRDGIITALQCLSFNPNLARGVLGYLASTQARTESAEQDAEPGKILHETRDGEMAMLGEVPFRRYYGSIDSTPLFIMLAGAYYECTGDTPFIRSIWPNVENALGWIEKYGDRDGDGFVEYARRSSHGLIHQGWKDSQDSVFQADGSLARAPIALCEVQGYVYAAYVAAGRLAEALGDRQRVRSLGDAASTLRRRFESAFWCEELSTFALALDGAKQPIHVRTSNAGHCLFAGIASPEQARRVAATLTSEASFSGWGVRTVAAGEARYNPMSYHNGSIWPHDNSLIAAGFARYDFKEEAATILTGLFDASIFFDLHRLPELFCGFQRRPHESPTLYPVACSPQAWASGAVFLLLESCLGLRVHGLERRIELSNPFLPQSLEQISIRGLRVGEASVDLLATRHHGGDVGVNVVRREGRVDVVILK